MPITEQSDDLAERRRLQNEQFLAWARASSSRPSRKPRVEPVIHVQEDMTIYPAIFDFGKKLRSSLRTVEGRIEMEGRHPTRITLALGIIATAVFFALVYSLANNPDWLKGLGRVANLNFDFNVGDLVFGILGGGAALWAAKTFASTSQGGPAPTTASPASSPPPPPGKTSPTPSRGGAGEEAASDDYSYRATFEEIISRLQAIEERLGLRAAPSPESEATEGVEEARGSSPPSGGPSP